MRQLKAIQQGIHNLLPDTIRQAPVGLPLLESVHHALQALAIRLHPTLPGAQSDLEIKAIQDQAIDLLQLDKARQRVPVMPRGYTSLQQDLILFDLEHLPGNLGPELETP